MTNAPILGYANPQTMRRPSVVLAAVLMLTGLALIFLGGCFLIGVMFSMFSFSGAPVPLSPGALIFQGILYTLAAAAFTGAAFLISLAFRWLKRIALPGMQGTSR